jgi:hypothetical protein
MTITPMDNMKDVTIKFPGRAPTHGRGEAAKADLMC